ncbi:MAG TPA: ribosome silencing factor [Prevotellaceae bacterium]|nr:ribosome silencing factor [Prevotellaceae bacterium]
MEIKDKLVTAIVDGLQDKKGKDIVVVDLTGMEDAVCKYFVICTGGSPAQVQALTRSAADKARTGEGAKPLAVDGLRNSRWVAMDYAEAIVHIMLAEERAFYDIEHLWEDAELVSIPSID